MSDGADVLVIGGGVNGLVCATLLARAGRAVTVLENAPRLGGLAAPEVFHPGFTAPGLLHDTCLLRPWLVEELGLGEHGLRWREREPTLLAADPGGRGLLLALGSAMAPAEVAAASRAEADAWVAFHDRVDELRRVLLPLLDERLPALPPDGLPAWWELLGRAFALRRLGRARLAELLAILPKAAADWTEEWFASPLLRGALCALAVQGTRLAPRSPGSAGLLLLGEVARWRTVQGGPAAVVAALEGAARAAGVTLRTCARVAGLRLDGPRVAGVHLADGEDLAAPVVVSTVDPRQTFRRLLPPTRLPPPLPERARTWRARGTTAVVRLAIEGALEFRGREGQAIERALVVGSPLEVEQACRAAKYGTLPERPLLDVAVPSIGAHDLAPAGRNVVTILVHAVPHALEGGWGGGARDALLERVLARLASCAPGVEQQVLARQVLAPVDLEQRLLLSGGQIHHGEPALDQLLFLRPALECSRGVTPVPGLYLGGSGSHPGGGVTGVPGALAARAVLAG